MVKEVFFWKEKHWDEGKKSLLVMKERKKKEIYNQKWNIWDKKVVSKNEWLC